MFNDGDIEQVEHATEEIDKYIDYRAKNSFQKNFLRKLCKCISVGISIWCGDTYIGEQKDPKELLVYQQFFCKLVQLICMMERNSIHLDRAEARFLKSIKYNGIIYRYLGSSDHNNRSRIHPITCSQYVSWTKDKDKIYPYIRQKLYGPITLIAYDIDENDFGIDLVGFYDYCCSNEIRISWNSRRFENEVVYQTPQISEDKIAFIEDEVE
jgi:hypothetical protein